MAIQTQYGKLSGTVESPLLPVTVWDSGPLDLGAPDLTWVRAFRLKVWSAAASTLTITTCLPPSIAASAWRTQRKTRASNPHGASSSVSPGAQEARSRMTEL